MKKLISWLIVVCMLCMGGASLAESGKMAYLGGYVMPDNTTGLVVYIPVDTEITAANLDVRVDDVPVDDVTMTPAGVTWAFVVDNFNRWDKGWAGFAKRFVEQATEQMGQNDNGMVLTSDRTWKNTFDLKLVGKEAISEQLASDQPIEACGITADKVVENFIHEMASIQNIHKRVCVVILSQKDGIEKGTWGTLKENVSKADVVVYTVSVKPKETDKSKSFAGISEASQGGLNFAYNGDSGDKRGEAFIEESVTAMAKAEKLHAKQVTINGSVFTKAPDEISISVKKSNPVLEVYVPMENNKFLFNFEEEPVIPEEPFVTDVVEPEPVEVFVPTPEPTWTEKALALPLEYKIAAGLGVLLVVLLIVLLISKGKKKARRKVEEAAQAKQEEAEAGNGTNGGFIDDDGETQPIESGTRDRRTGKYHLELRQVNSSNVYTAEFNDTLLVGRSREKADLTVYPEDKKISGLNCEFRMTPEGVLTLKDRGSTNGTFLNGSKLAAMPVRVNQGDIVKMGLTQFRVVWTVL